jgi:hypothetical protein
MLTVAAFVFATATAVIMLGISAGRQQVVRAREWWIPLFLKAAGATAVAAGTGVLTAEYVGWWVQDAEIENVVRHSSVKRTDRQTRRTIYEFNVPATGGWSMLIRYDFEVIWEEVAALGAVGGVVGGLLALLVARLTMRRRDKTLGFPVNG